MGRLDHVHIRVPDRAEAATWYSEHLGFEPVEEFDLWASGFEGGPLQISVDGGETTLDCSRPARATPWSRSGQEFSVDVVAFADFARIVAPGDRQPCRSASGAERRGRLRPVLGLRPR